MPYKITAIREHKTYTNLADRSTLAYAILKNLSALGLSLMDIQSLLTLADYPSEIRLMGEERYLRLTEHQPQLDFIYNVITLKTNEKLYFHTNWQIPKEQWQKLSEKLNEYQIYVSTI